MDAFDADVLIYAAVPGHRLGRRVRALFPSGALEADHIGAGVGSVLLVPEILTRPLRDDAAEEVSELGALLGRLTLLPTTEATAGLAVALGVSYGLRAVDAVHLATAVGAGASRFITNNQSDFNKAISEIDITYPSDLADPGVPQRPSRFET